MLVLVSVLVLVLVLVLLPELVLIFLLALVPVLGIAADRGRPNSDSGDLLSRVSFGDLAFAWLRFSCFFLRSVTRHHGF